MIATTDPPEEEVDEELVSDANVGIDDSMLLGSADGIPLPTDCDGNATGAVVEVAIGDAVFVVTTTVGTYVGL